MHLDVSQLGRTFFAEVDNVDIRQPLGDAVIREIEEAIAEHAVLLFRAPGITDEEQIAFSERFGGLEAGALRIGRAWKNIDPRVADLTNVGPDGEIMAENEERLQFQRGNQLWHTDSSFKEVPARYSILSARTVPDEGGETEWADLRAAWDALPQAKKDEFDGLIAEHSLLFSRALYGFTDFNEEERAQWPTVQQALVRTHPLSGRKCLYIGSHAGKIVGWEEDKGRTLLSDLLTFATRPEFTYTHSWTVGDVVMWDNRCTLHRGHPWPDRNKVRVMRRTTVGGSGPTVVNGHPVDERVAA